MKDVGREGMGWDKKKREKVKEVKGKREAHFPVFSNTPRFDFSRSKPDSNLRKFSLIFYFAGTFPYDLSQILFLLLLR